MPSLPFSYSAFQPGLNLRDAPYELADGMSPDLLNVQGMAAGAIVKRRGSYTLLSGLGQVHSVFGSPGLYGDNSQVIVAAGTGLYAQTGGLGPASPIKTGLSGQPWAFAGSGIVAGQGPFYGVNGTDAPLQWRSGTAVAWTKTSGGVNVPNGTILLAHQNQLFTAGTTVLPTGLTGPTDPTSTVYWSAIADPTNWDPLSLTGAGWMEFDPHDGEAITGLGVVGPYMLVFKPHKTWVLLDPATATDRKLSDSVGCAAALTVSSSPVGTFFLSEDRGVYVTDGSKLTPISDNILPAFGFQWLSCGAYCNGHYYISVPGATDYIYDYDTILGSWWRHIFPSGTPATLVTWNDGNGHTLLLAGATVTGVGNVSELFAASADTDGTTNAIPWHWFGPFQSPSFYRRRRFPTPYFRKRLRQIRCGGYGNVDLSIGTDFGTGTLVQSNVFNGSLTPVDGVKVFISQTVNNVFQVQFSGSDKSAAAVYEYTLYVHDRVDSQDF